MNYRSLVGNTFIAFAAQGVSLVASLVMSLLVPKVLGLETYGYWQLFIFYASYSGFFHFGLNDGIYLLEGGVPREQIDKRRINAQFRIACAIQVIVVFGIMLFGASIANSNQRFFVIVAFSLYTALVNLSAYFGYVFQAMNETKLFSFMTMLERAVFLIPMVAMVVLRVQQFEPFVISYLFARACTVLYALWHARDFLRAGGLGVSESLGYAWANIKVGFSLMAANIASMLILGIARALIDSIWGIETFGKVSFALSMVNFFITFVSQASMVLFPALRQGTESEQRSFYKSVRDLMELIFPLVYVLYFPMVAILSAWLPQYAASMRYFAILLPICVFDAKMGICGTTFFKVLREEKALLWVNIGAMAFSAVSSAVGIFLLDSLDAVLFGSVVAIIGRSMWSERYLDARLSVAASRFAAQEVLLTLAFILAALTLPSLTAALSYACLYALYLVGNRNHLITLIGLAGRVAKR